MSGAAAGDPLLHPPPPGPVPVTVPTPGRVPLSPAAAEDIPCSQGETRSRSGEKEGLRVEKKGRGQSPVSWDSSRGVWVAEGAGTQGHLGKITPASGKVNS